MNKLVLNLVNQNVVGLSYQVPQVVVVFSEGKTLVNSDFYSKTTNQHKRTHVRDLHPATFELVQATPAEIEAACGIETREGK